MTEDFRNKDSVDAGTGKATAEKARENRLAEELRANLKRRKASARRQKEQAGEPPSDEREA